MRIRKLDNSRIIAVGIWYLFEITLASCIVYTTYQDTKRMRELNAIIKEAEKCIMQPDTQQNAELVQIEAENAKLRAELQR
jgi:hypothetical protein